MKKAGIVGGIGPASTLDYYSGTINGCRELTGSDEYPEIVIDSVNMTEMLGYVSEKRFDELIAFLLRSVHHLAAAGADFAAIASNTPHIVFSEVEKHSELPLISIVDETCDYARGKGYKKVAVIGTLFTMRSGLYADAFERYGIKAFVPDTAVQNAIHNIIFPDLENGLILPNEKARMLDIASKLIMDDGADALVLGCTELPLMIRQGDLKTDLLNTTQIHIDSIVKKILE